MFLIQKNRWDELYQVHRRLWMPEWCVNCAYMWLAILPALLLAVFVHPLIVVAPVLVPPFANLLHLGRW